MITFRYIFAAIVGFGLGALVYLLVSSWWA